MRPPVGVLARYGPKGATLAGYNIRCAACAADRAQQLPSHNLVESCEAGVSPRRT